ncbi:hypothetical protein P5X59_06330 [Staphylococcus cohnii]|uniref:Phage protein n=1 Tax=Staphylococcus cohnii TaxID=29382 RepID=A0ABT6IZL0_9STAP|nr:hypothetical protein [Staphylococcus cohnii]MDH5140054.1 hypothetical protein [Staphylococcus cohnii]MDH5157937.1 hypothetical protein [Staphylococcus cohnii]MDH5169636.1 hypothetical protein [Staphylococcus cohnii]
MVKIKQKKQLNLPQLIEWLLKSGYRNYTANSNMGNTVTLSRYGAIQFSPGTFYPEETFTVEVEEEITEDTFFKHLIKVTEDGRHYSVDSLEVRDLIYLSTEEVHAYIDGEYKLIWTHEKGLVE